MSSTSQVGVGGSQAPVESMNFTVVEQKLSPYVESYNTYYENIQDIDTKVAENVQQAGGAIGGLVGQSLYTEWSENCVPLLNFKRYFEDIKGRISTIYNANADAYNASMDQYAVDQNGNPTDGIVTEKSDVYSVYGDGAYTGGNSTGNNTGAAEANTEANTEVESEEKAEPKNGLLGEQTTLDSAGNGMMVR